MCFNDDDIGVIFAICIIILLGNLYSYTSVIYSFYHMHFEIYLNHEMNIRLKILDFLYVVCVTK